MVKNNNSFPVSKRDGVINGLIVNIQVFIKINLTAMDRHLDGNTKSPFPQKILLSFLFIGNIYA